LELSPVSPLQLVWDTLTLLVVAKIISRNSLPAAPAAAGVAVVMVPVWSVVGGETLA
jgi:hypothetical protein